MEDIRPLPSPVLSPVPFTDITTKLARFSQLVADAGLLVTRIPRLYRLDRVLRSPGATAFGSPYVRKFQAEMGKRIGTKHVIAVSSGTAALHTSLIAAGVGPGDEVIVPALSCVVTASSVLFQGGTPRFVDVNLSDGNIDVTLVEKAITPKTKAIIGVHLNGIPCSLFQLRSLADQYQLLLIEDAAQAQESTFKGKKVGSIGDLACFSHYPAKNLPIGEGGLVCTNSDHLANRVRIAMNMGETCRNGTATYGIEDYRPNEIVDYSSIGYNYRMSAVQALKGLYETKRLDGNMARRKENALALIEGLKPLPWLVSPHYDPNEPPCFNSLFIRVDKKRAPIHRDELVAWLWARGTVPIFSYQLPLPSYSVFKVSDPFPNAQELCDTGIQLKIDPWISLREIKTMARQMVMAFK